MTEMSDPETVSDWEYGAILAKRGKGKNLCYLVRWEDGTQIWESETNVPEFAINKFGLFSGF